MIPHVTKQVPKLSLFRAGDDPSCCHAAPNTLRPDRRNTESSTATVIASPPGTSSITSHPRDRQAQLIEVPAARAKK